MGISAGQLVEGRYLIEREIGAGGSAQVFRALDKRTGKAVAFKRVQLDGEGDPKRLRAVFSREVKALSLLEDEGIVRLLDVSPEQDAERWVVTELLDGTDLQQLLDDKGRCPERAVGVIALRALAALAKAHDKGIAHRDLKPGNLFLCRSGRLVLIDFGVARGTQQADSQTIAKGLGTSIAGTPHFLSPEQLQGVTVSLASDLYSLGITLRYLLTGEVPFSGGMIEIMQAIMVGRKRAVDRRALGLQTQLIDVIEGLSHLEPALRPESAQAARTQVLRALGDLRSAEEAYAAWVELVFDAGPTERMTSGEGQTQIVTATAVTPMHGESETSLHTVPTTARSGRSPGLGARLGPRFAFLGIALLALTSAYLGRGVWRRAPAPAPALAPLTAPSVTAELPLPASAPALPPALAREASRASEANEASEAKPTDAKRKPATLSVTLKQWAEVSVDGVELGRRQISTRLQLSPGRHEIVFRNPKFSERRVLVNLPPGASKAVDVDFSADGGE